MDEETERRSRGCAGGVATRSTAGPMLSPLFVMRSGTMIQREAVSLLLSFSLSRVYQAQYPRREISPFFSFFFFFLFPRTLRWREPPQPISLIRCSPIYARYESTRGQAEESRWIMIETVAVIRFRTLSLSLCWLINRVLRDHALALWVSISLSLPSFLFCERAFVSPFPHFFLSFLCVWLRLVWPLIGNGVAVCFSPLQRNVLFRRMEDARSRSFRG